MNYSRLSAIHPHSPLYLALSVTLSFPILADDSIERFEVVGEQHSHHNTAQSMNQLLQQMGVDFSAAGGVSALPVMNGMMGDRIKVLIDGMDITAACANQMNPPLSYISASQLSAAQVVAGVSPVSAGGDNIAGVISVAASAPMFSDDTSLRWQGGYLSSQYRSGSDAVVVGAGATVASKSWAFDYRGSYEDANSYQDGHGDKVLDTLYRSQNHVLSTAWRDQVQTVTLKLSHQYIPFQGFANQYMDMTNNRSSGVNLNYQRQFDTGELQARVNWHGVSHEMGFFTEEKLGVMPMNTDADDYSYDLRWTQTVWENAELRLGQEYHEFRIDDSWPAVAGSAMMGPNDYININNGKRQRIAAFAELAKPLTPTWWMSLGARFEHVVTNADPVQSYNSMTMMGMPNVDYQAALAFNAAERKASDNLWDAVLQLRYQINEMQQIEFGFAVKNRAPNLYERYSWGRGVMASTMIGWFGDGNGYVGDIQLKPETAYTSSLEYSANFSRWQFSSSLWYSKVDDYIDTKVIGSFNRSGLDNGVRNLLQFTNVDATLYGANLSAAALLSDGNAGEWSLRGKLSSSHGERDTDNQPLYQISPLKTELALEHQLGRWQSQLNWQFVGSKSRVDGNRLENPTHSYHLVNVSTQFNVADFTISLAVENLLDRYYQQPLGGVSLAEYRADASQGFQQLAGPGRSFNVGLSYQF
ncbi:TonB-dependent receptor [Shewanella mangrovi]|uniref:TonB-dependent receptor n=1 Tax=Shewanella mangrovi TaxID=1515746 RepID=A0A094LU97_9GAMM|nr:TonB-dependent receptor [Shewanella mangrovi]KFZ38768.1 TonB-dependent receptor [Shewanella mangrovi]